MVHNIKEVLEQYVEFWLHFRHDNAKLHFVILYYTRVYCIWSFNLQYFAVY